MEERSDDGSFCPSDVSDEGSSNGESSSVAMKGSSNSEVYDSDSEGSRELSEYEKLRAERIKRNLARLEALGLHKARNELNEAVTPQPTSDCAVVQARKRPASAPVEPRRKSPRLQHLQQRKLVDLSRPRRRYCRHQSTSTSTSLVSRTKAQHALQASKAVLVGTAKRNILKGKHGDMVVHPMKLKNIRAKVKSGRLPEELHKDFLVSCTAWLIHQGKTNCMNYQDKTIQTKCSCLKTLVDADNSEETIDQVANSLCNYFSMPKQTHHLCMKDWILAATNIKNIAKPSLREIQKYFNVAGVFIDAPESQHPFCVCQNTLMKLYNFGYKKYSTVKGQIHEAFLKPHGLTAKESNFFKSKKEKFVDINRALKVFFDRLRDEHSETHATRVIREKFGIGLRAEEVDTVELPSSMTKRQLYCQFCFTRGWSIRADAKGKLPKLSDYPRRPFDDHDWPPGSMCKPVPSRFYFLAFWVKHYPKMKIRNPSEDTCNECWKYKNQLGVLSRKMNDQIRKERAENDNDLAEETEEQDVSALLAINPHVDSNEQEDDEEENINNLLNLMDVTDYSPPTNISSTSSNQTSVEDEIIEQEGSAHDQSMCDIMDDTTFTSQLVREEEMLFTLAGRHVKQARAMREFCNAKTDIARSCEDRNVPWAEHEITEVGDYAQNEGVPHFGCEQPGDIYYFSPLGVYIFGIVRLYKKETELIAQYYFEGEGKKGGNNVASLIWNKLYNIERMVEKSEKEGPAKSYTLIMDNCGGQNKNRMVIRLMLMLVEIGVFQKTCLAFLVRGHTKNACDRMFMLLKQNFHKKTYIQENNYTTISTITWV